jgi:hypothetical protein
VLVSVDPIFGISLAESGRFAFNAGLASTVTSREGSFRMDYWNEGGNAPPASEGLGPVGSVSFAPDLLSSLGARVRASRLGVPEADLLFKSIPLGQCWGAASIPAPAAVFEARALLVERPAALRRTSGVRAFLYLAIMLVSGYIYPSPLASLVEPIPTNRFYSPVSVRGQIPGCLGSFAFLQVISGSFVFLSTKL